ncbi:hypothetical protein CTA1_2241 [Colletotrichum tanaceti]|uniref:Uncharacterized protein n=1 Tax=Colletotrichum tanaceti TaxID=1306861 RepID=A0A4U6XNB1_9PEZI|nr:hypothetical protein CTA1_2241 [Colletotrichum tanaceti]
MPSTTKHSVKFSVKFSSIKHISDFARVKAVHNLSGVYIDLDRKSRFNAINSPQLDNNMRSGSFMSKKGSKMVFYNGALTTVAHSLVPEPGEMLIMNREAFSLIGWTFADACGLSSLHKITTR